MTSRRWKAEIQLDSSVTCDLHRLFARKLRDRKGILLIGDSTNPPLKCYVV